MSPVVSAQGLFLRLLRKHGPSLLGAKRRVVNLEGGRSTEVLELGTNHESTLVFLHGFGDRPEHFLGTARALAHRHRVLIPAMAGFGEGNISLDANHSLETFGEFASDLVDRIGGDRFHLMGNSLGGACALSVARALGSRVQSLTLVDIAGVKPAGISCVFDDFENAKNPFEIRTLEDQRAFMAAVSYRQNPAFAFVEEALFLENRAKADWYSRLARELALSVREFVERGDDAFVNLGAIANETLVVWGEHDALFPPSIGEHIVKKMPNARFELLRGVGHCPHLEAPDRLAKAFSAVHGS